MSFKASSLHCYNAVGMLAYVCVFKLIYGGFMELASESKFCVKCLHYRHKGKGHLCAATKQTVLNMVTGEYHEDGLIDCTVRRKSECGEEGNMFVKKPIDKMV